MLTMAALTVFLVLTLAQRIGQESLGTTGILAVTIVFGVTVISPLTVVVSFTALCPVKEFRPFAFTVLSARLRSPVLTAVRTIALCLTAGAYITVVTVTVIAAARIMAAVGRTIVMRTSIVAVIGTAVSCRTLSTCLGTLLSVTVSVFALLSTVTLRCMAVFLLLPCRTFATFTVTVPCMRRCSRIAVIISVRARCRLFLLRLCRFGTAFKFCIQDGLHLIIYARKIGRFYIFICQSLNDFFCLYSVFFCYFKYSFRHLVTPSVLIPSPVPPLS